MPHALREQAFNRFEPRDDPKVKVFDVAPAAESALVKELRAHVQRKGTPDTWEWHLNTRPPKDAPMPTLVAKNIDVPEALRPDVGKAPCPLCCITAPKYYYGILTWWPEEKALRVIGIECARALFGDAFDKELRRFHRQQQANTDFDFLIDALPLVGAMQGLIAKLAPDAEALDRLRNRAMKGLSKRTAKLIHQHVSLHDGNFVLYEERWVETESSRVRARAIANRFQCHGAAMLLEWKLNASALLHSAAVCLRGLDHSTEDEILEATSQMGPEGLERARVNILEAARALREAHRLCRAVQDFLAPGNLERVLEWACDPRAEIPLDIRKDRFGAFVLYHKPHTISVPPKAPELTAALPNLAFLDSLARP